MGLSRTELFTDDQNALATAAKALGHPARIAILQHLMAQQSCITSDLVEELGLAQATVSQHLRALRDEGIIQGTVEGVKRNYCLEPERCFALVTALRTLLDKMETAGRKCC